jgi:endonuclease/exonuclease/phosphatase family metal-dependent hydrolase
MSHKILFLLFLTLGCISDESLAQISAQGTESTLDVATWNIEWFGSASNGPSDDALQLQQVAAIIGQSEIDIWGLQEIADVTRFDELVQALGPDWTGVLATISTSQRLAWVYRTNMFQNVQAEHILTEQAYSYDFASRPPLALQATVLLPDTTLVVRMANVHMKAFMDQSSWERRVRASGHLKTEIERSQLEDKNSILLGDFNDGVTGSYFNGQASPYANFAQDTAHYTLLTAPLELNGESSYVGFVPGSSIDHIIVSNDLAQMYRNDARTYTGLQFLNDYINTVSDHLPVIASFGIQTSTSLEPAVGEYVSEIALSSLEIYPNPSVGGDARLSITSRCQSEATVQVVDLLGRTVASKDIVLRAGKSNHVLGGMTDLPNGAYLIGVSTMYGFRSRVLVIRH